MITMDNWYASREKYRPDYSILANSLIETFNFTSALDVGSANGFLIDNFYLKGKTVYGVELSSDSVNYMSIAAKANTTIGDITEMEKIGDFDLVTCIEVAEHIDKSKSETLVKALIKNAKDSIYFTAATPFQGGRGHINCQPHFFWISLFYRHGFNLDIQLTNQLIEKISGLEMCYWLPMNSLVFSSNKKQSNRRWLI